MNDDTVQKMLDLIGQATMEVARRHALENFIASIISHMQAERQGLDAAIEAVDTHAHLYVEIEPLAVEVGETPEIREQLRQMVHDTAVLAADHVRAAVTSARELVTLADLGADR